MVKPSHTVDGAGRISSVVFSVIVPVALVSAYLLVSRIAVRSINGSGDFPALFVCALVGAVPIFRSRISLFCKIAFGFAYMVVVGMLLGMYALTVDCWLFHDCD
jgi:hypothetical protein